eukprot:2796454-Amphidinium_carterae.2
MVCFGRCAKWPSPKSHSFKKYSFCAATERLNLVCKALQAASPSGSLPFPASIRPEHQKTMATCSLLARLGALQSGHIMCARSRQWKT